MPVGSQLMTCGPKSHVPLSVFWGREKESPPEHHF